MKYLQINPPEQLNRDVAFFWIHESNSKLPEEASTEFKLIVDGMPGMIFQERAGSFQIGPNICPPQFFVYGQKTKYYPTVSSGVFKNIGACLKPAGIKSIFGIDAYELTDYPLAIEEIPGFSNATDQLIGKPTNEQIILLMEIISQAISGNTFLPERSHSILEQIHKGFSLQAIQKENSITERTLERIFKNEIGVRPNLYAKIARFQHALHLINQGKLYNLTEIAHHAGYFDQSHLIRDFRKFAGTTPGHFIQTAKGIINSIPHGID